ncbi:hypothetical protein HAZT_HAZT005377 [Hyalella azteca]|uniref:Metalloendopeptidase n=1 Tax=Hyalella azteca TaxID=294128 RepID=A0A6A0GRK8_HYAAZ|nr:low choriolytic enzyme [Hyalella azteca]KAA0184408.1 hypothetical protein HAZT_HAZT005377 [Hyalella azteca]
MHELLHALGLRHEHSRPDRDLHIAVNWNNIKPGSRHHFQVDNGYTFLDIPYDFDSVMHYGRNAFAKNSSVGVLTALTSPTRPLGGAVLTELDRRRLQVLYGCYNAMH